MNKYTLSAALIFLCTVTSAQKPVITLVSPSASDDMNNSGLVLVRAEIISTTPLQKFSIINKEAVIVSETELSPQKKNDETYLIEANIPLRKGWNTVYVDALNSSGRTISEKRKINCKPEPFIKLLYPGSYNTNIVIGAVNIKAEIKSDDELQFISLNISGTRFENLINETIQRDDGIYYLEKSVQLLKGVNRIYLTAANSNGITKSVSRNINIGEEYTRFNKNSIYGTLGIGPMYGTALGNYERVIYQPSDLLLSSVRLRIGAGKWVVWDAIGTHYLGTFQALWGGGRNHFEAGAGAVLIDDGYKTAFDSRLNLYPAGNIGYRLQKPGGFGLFRAGIGFPEALYLSFGVSF